MTRPTALKLLFNATGVLIGVILVGYIVYSGLVPDTTTSCHASYPASTRLSLRNAQGALLSPIELQARAGLNEWGTMQNAAVVERGADDAALKVKLATLSEAADGASRTTNGVHFNWKLAPMREATAACLSYSVWLPKGFAFEEGGVLPGMIGGVAGDVGDASRFATRARWQSDGELGLDVALPGSRFLPADRDDAPLAAGRWTRIDQEIVLNTPGKADGLVRLWVDGDQAGEKTQLALRKDADGRFLGVRVDIGYLEDPAKAGEVRVTPFQLSWR